MRTAFTSFSAAIAIGMSACGDGAAEPSTELYFLSADRSAPVPVTRPGTLSAREALEQLLRGPNDEEADRGIATAIPSATRLRELRVDDGDARIDLSGLPSTPSAAERFRIITQFTKSLVGRSGVHRLWFRNDGAPWGLWRVTGGVRDGPYEEGACTSVGVGEPVTETVVADSFSSC